MKFRKYDPMVETLVKERENKTIKNGNENFPICVNKCAAIVCHKYTQEGLKRQIKNLEIQLEISKINNRELKAKLANYENRN